MNKLQLRNGKKELIRQSLGEPVEYVAMVKGSKAAIFPGACKTRYNFCITNGFVHVMSALDGDVMELF